MDGEQDQTARLEAALERIVRAASLAKARLRETEAARDEAVRAQAELVAQSRAAAPAEQPDRSALVARLDQLIASVAAAVETPGESGEQPNPDAHPS